MAPERSAVHHSENDRRPAVILCGRLSRNFPHGRLIVILDAAPDGVREQLAAQGPDEIFLVAGQIRPEPFDADGTQFAGVDRYAVGLNAPRADSVEVLE